jgi:transcriptional regulator with XRE-family HTH domain
MTMLVTDRRPALTTVSGVATQRTTQRHFYLAEWLEYRGLSDQAVGDRMGIARETVWRWRVGDRRPRHELLIQLAQILEIELEQFWQPPSRPSLDALLKHAPDDEHARAYDIVQRLIRKSS